MREEPIFATAAITYSCDRRMVALWHGRMPWDTDVFNDIRGALADMPRSGRPTKSELGRSVDLIYGRESADPRRDWEEVRRW